MDATLPKTSAAGTTIALDGVPETLLWPLWNRAGEQKNDSPLIDDPIAAKLVEQIDYDFRANFGKQHVSHAIRSRVMDDAIKAWLRSNPHGTVVSLGEGLDSQFWRVDNGSMKWLTVDLAESIHVRLKYLPAEKRMTMIECSALDSMWMEKAPDNEPVFIVAAGLLMFFEEADVMALLKQIARRFPGSEMMFDIIPPWLSKKTMKGWRITKTYQTPPMPWGLNYNQYSKILNAHPRYKIKRQMTYADPFPERMRPYNYLSKISFLRNRLAPWIVHLEIGN
jgi:O-methyltransferase involved in polyketide biosynthesis